MHESDSDLDFRNVNGQTSYESRERMPTHWEESEYIQDNYQSQDLESEQS